MAPPSDIAPISAPISATSPSAPVTGLALANAATALQPTATAAAITAQVMADLTETLAQDLPAPAASPLSVMVGEAATQQEGLAPLLADLAVAVNSPAMPPAARAVAAQILAAQAPLGADVTAGELRTAAQNSGVFLEAALANVVASGADTPPLALQQDLKALLLQLTNELAPLVQGPAPSGPANSPAPRATSTRASPNQLEPPVSGGPTAGQPAARPSVDFQTHAEALAQALQREAQGALARVQLSQAASVEKAGETTRWMFEVPIATPDGAGIAQFEISRDGHRTANGAAVEPSWRARFSVNAAPGGPVHADVMLGAGRARVTLMAEDPAARATLEAHQSELAQALAAEQGPDVAVRIVGGAPPRPEQPPGQLVDRRS